MNPSKPLISYGHKKSDVLAVVLMTTLLQTSVQCTCG